MNVLITGSSNGIGLSTANKFLKEGHEVYGIDLEESKIDNEHYHHYVGDISIKETLPELPIMEIIINNAGKQNSLDDINNNLKGTINVTEKYAFNSKLKSILFNASASAHTGFEFPEYCASKAGIIAYMKNVAVRVSKYGATCNSISCGGVLTDLNKPVTEDMKLWKKIMDVTPLKKWATPEEIAEWIYFLTIINKSATGIDVLIDNGETNLNCTFVWPDFKN
ncbi:MAG: SDR family oxidoreductase [Erysipelotrichales bacterium]|nr:SDR family oxidoreductase [Erysipelotrichales bacterium]